MYLIKLPLYPELFICKHLVVGIVFRLIDSQIRFHPLKHLSHVSVVLIGAQVLAIHFECPDQQSIQTEFPIAFSGSVLLLPFADNYREYDVLKINIFIIFKFKFWW